MSKKKKKEKKTKKILVLFLLIISLGLIYAHYIEPYSITIKEYKIENNKLPKSFDGIKIIHFSDLHYGSTIKFNELKKVVNLINNENPDIVVFTGDFFDKRFKIKNKELDKIKEELSKINNNLGNYAVDGNHDYKYSEDLKKVMEGNFLLLENSETLIYYKDNTPISIVGLTDKTETKVNYEIFEKENEYFRIVLAHEPDEFNKIKDYSFDVLLSGHSHNGQIRLPFIGAIYTPVGAKTYYDEHYKIDNKLIFISNGLGTSTINFRFNSKPSINLYRLYAY